MVRGVALKKVAGFCLLLLLRIFEKIAVVFRLRWLLSFNFVLGALYVRLDCRPDDIYVSSFMKSGTTWLQVILYQLLHGGNAVYNHIHEASPWIEALTAKELQTLKSRTSPRVFKTHLEYDRVPRQIPVRFVYIVRNGMDTTVSFYHHVKNYFNPEITFEKVQEMVLGTGENSWFRHVSGWLGNEHGHRVHYLTYEGLKSDTKGEIRRLADFCGIALDEALLARVLEKSSFENMKKDEDKFGLRPGDVKLHPGARFDQFIRKGKTKEGFKYFTPDQLHAYEAQLVREFGDEALIAPYLKSIREHLAGLDLQAPESSPATAV